MAASREAETRGSGLPFLIAVFAIAFLYGAGGSLLFTAGDQKALTPLPIAAQVIALITGCAFGAAFVLLVVFGWRQGGGRAAVSSRSRAERTGVLPSDAQGDVWLPRLRARRQSLSQLRWLMPFLAATQLGIAVLHHVKPDGIYPTLFYAGDAVLFVAFGISSLVTYPGRVRNLDRLIAELE